MKVFKIVRYNIDGSLISFFAEGKALVRYIPNEKTYPPMWLAEQGYHLVAFLSFLSAKDYLERSLDVYRTVNFQLWEAEVSETDILMNFPNRINMRNLKIGRLDGESRCWINGTIMCKNLTLIRRIIVGKC